MWSSLSCFWWRLWPSSGGEGLTMRIAGVGPIPPAPLQPSTILSLRVRAMTATPRPLPQVPSSIRSRRRWAARSTRARRSRCSHRCSPIPRPRRAPPTPLGGSASTRSYPWMPGDHPAAFAGANVIDSKVALGALDAGQATTAGGGEDAIGDGPAIIVRLARPLCAITAVRVSEGNTGMSIEVVGLSDPSRCGAATEGAYVAVARACDAGGAYPPDGAPMGQRLRSAAIQGGGARRRMAPRPRPERDLSGSARVSAARAAPSAARAPRSPR